MCQVDCVNFVCHIMQYIKLHIVRIRDIYSFHLIKREKYFFEQMVNCLKTILNNAMHIKFSFIQSCLTIQNSYGIMIFRFSVFTGDEKKNTMRTGLERMRMFSERRLLKKYLQ